MRVRPYGEAPRSLIAAGGVASGAVVVAVATLLTADQLVDSSRVRIANQYCVEGCRPSATNVCGWPAESGSGTDVNGVAEAKLPASIGEVDQRMS